MLEIVEKWLKGLGTNKNTEKLKTGKYKEELVYIHMEAETYTLISYSKDGKGIFSVNKEVLQSIT